ncbi:hypothetical protein [Streptomyces sp. NPDC058953]|uniref:hypothetical protein n=1 Tax=unclassified Streptomyces TaxID=2593676 RepID=UPI0036A3E768
MIRRPVAAVAAVVLALEAMGVVVINGILARFVDVQSMSLDGLDPGTMVVGTWVTGVGTGLFLAACAAIALTTAVRDRAPGRVARGVLIAAAVLHGALGALTVGLVGWTAFAVVMAVLGLIVLLLMSYDTPRRACRATTRDNGEGPDPGPGPGPGPAVGGAAPV